MEKELQMARAESFRQLHQMGKPLVLANAWDVASAKAFASCGFPAVATTSAGVAAAYGYQDGQCLPKDLMLEAVSRMAHALDVPVTADIESGYGETTADVLTTIEELVQTGAVGFNLEDATKNPGEPLYELEAQVEKIAAIREWTQKQGLPLVINARTDLYWHGVGDPKSRLEQTIRRAKAYRDAGADCIFVPGLAEEDAIQTLVQELACPINLLAGPATPSIARLAELGVARVSVGSGPMRAMMTFVQTIGKELLEKGTYRSFTEQSLPYAEMQQMF